MNYLTGIVILFLALAMARGFIRGFVKTLFSMIFFILVLVTAAFLTKPVTGVVSGSKNVRAWVEDQSEQFLEDQAGTETDEDGLAVAIIGTALQVNGIRKIAAEKMTDFFLNLIGFLAALILSAVLWIVIEIILNRITKKHTIGAVNRIFGLLLGLLRGLIVVWIVFGLISTMQFTTLGGELESQIQNSIILSTINRGNLIAQFLPQFILSLLNV